MGSRQAMQTTEKLVDDTAPSNALDFAANKIAAPVAFGQASSIAPVDGGSGLTGFASSSFKFTLSSNSAVVGIDKLSTATSSQSLFGNMPAKAVVDEDARELDGYLEYLQSSKAALGDDVGGHFEELKTTPMFTWSAKCFTGKQHVQTALGGTGLAKKDVFTQYALLGMELPSHQRPDPPPNNPIFLNTNAPWSAFICGSQGSGKSYTLSCILESCLIASSPIIKGKSPLAGLLFNYDQHNTEPCELVKLSTHIPVNVLVSPSNYHQMKKRYKGHNVTVYPLIFDDKHLNTKRMLKLMAVHEENTTPLYIEAVQNVLRDMAIDSRGTKPFSYSAFRANLDECGFRGQQKTSLNMRLALLESFIDRSNKLKQVKCKGDIFASRPGTLTVVDMSCPFVDPSFACTIFDMCLSIVLEGKSPVGHVVALDEAHKFMAASGSGDFTESLLTLIREQRHKGARVVIATQEPTVSPKLLDLCNMTFVHRFSSPSWLGTLKQHLAGASALAGMTDERVEALFKEIVGLHVGESLLFSPAAILDVDELSFFKLGAEHAKFKTRPRLTADGGRSVMATDVGTAAKPFGS